MMNKSPSCRAELEKTKQKVISIRAMSAKESEAWDAGEHRRGAGQTGRGLPR